jgi:hypothetical protein
MKKQLLFLTLLCNSFILYCLDNSCLLLDSVPPDGLLFKNGIYPEWINFTKDDFYFPTEDNIRTKYNERFVSSIISQGDFIYILENTIDIRPGIDPDGFILRKIEKETGEEIWAYHNTFFSGNSNHESFHLESILSINEDEILVQGLRQFPFIDNDFPFWLLGPVNATPVVYTISNTDGKIIDIKISSDSTILDVKSNYRFGSQSLIENSNKFYYLYGGPNRKENGVMIFEMDENLEFIDTSTFSQIKIEGPENVLSSNIKPYQIRSLGNNKYVFSYRYVKDWGNIFGDDHLIQIAIVDLSDPEIPNVINRINLNEYFIEDYHVDDFMISVIDESIVIQKESYNGVLDQYWLLWMDMDGNIKAHIPSINTLENYYRNGITPCYSDDYQLIAYAAKDGNSKIDLLTFSQNDSTPTILKTLELENENHALINYTGKVIGNQLILGGWLATIIGENSPESNRARYVYNLSLNLDKLGIDLSVDTEEVAELNPAPILYPNPSDGVFILKDYNAVAFAYCTITDAQGRVVKKILKEDLQDSKIDLKNLANGNYFVTFYDRKNVQMYESSSVVKL